MESTFFAGASSKEEAEWLKEEAEILRRELEVIERRITEFERKKRIKKGGFACGKK